LRLNSVIAAAIALSVTAMLMPAPSHAQAWSEFFSLEDRFQIGFPGEPSVEDISYIAVNGEHFPARRYAANVAEQNFTVIVVNFASAYNFATARDSEEMIVLGAIAFAATNYRQRGEVTYDGYTRYDRLPAHKLQITEPDGRLLYVSIVLHEDHNMDARRLYIIEASAPPGAPPPLAFQGTFYITDENSERISYDTDADGHRIRIIPGSGGIPLPE
jgi:hypothetical protein